MLECFIQNGYNSEAASEAYFNRYPERRQPNMSIFGRLKENLVEYGGFNKPRPKNYRIQDAEDVAINVVGMVVVNPSISSRQIEAESDRYLLCQNGIIWFTDGSKIGDKAGAGVYGKTTRTKLSFALGSYASVFQAEIYAILACGMDILKTAPKRRTIQICTDRQAALMAIESSKVKSRLVLDCKKILNDLASCNRVILTWVPGHSGVPGNEEADRLARAGSIGYPIGPEPILGVPYSMGVSTMKELLNKEFEKSWQEAPVLRVSESKRFDQVCHLYQVGLWTLQRGFQESELGMCLMFR
ncbi:hypothetical protein NQ318_014627 [Aromia moschata]|uniref:RNase H type-1 domain-containing protein n=1 Tax=Aromia moschata TaxID=1265417 RepID=A0AAV8ZCR2_9CUCU|nr:hypothetical protein NQ318_014627 [Aromia moschata]